VVSLLKSTSSGCGTLSQCWVKASVLWCCMSASPRVVAQRSNSRYTTQDGRGGADNKSGGIKDSTHPVVDCHGNCFEVWEV
jgi:hypothetical protein